MQFQAVHLRVNDAATGLPTPCRIRVAESNGEEFAPFGRALDFAIGRGEDVGAGLKLGRQRWFAIDGACEIDLPVGELQISISKGPYYRPICQSTPLPPGKMALRFTLQRLEESEVGRVVSVDTRRHFFSPHDALLDGAADDLDVINLLIEPRTALGSNGNNYREVANLSAFSGQQSCLERYGSRLFVNSHNRHPVLGSLGLLNCHRIVFPLAFGGFDATDDWSLHDWARQCHRKRGLVVWTEPFAQQGLRGCEAVALAILGELDAYELTLQNSTASLRGWYALLDAGVVLPLVGASGRDSNCSDLAPLRTLVGTDDWIEGIREGNSQASNGPAIEFSLEGTAAMAKARGLQANDRLEIIANRIVIAESQPIGSDLHTAEASAEVRGPAWVAARVWSHNAVVAHTSAKIVGEPERQPAAVIHLNDILESGREWVELHARFHQERFKRQLLDRFHEAMAKLHTA